MAVFLQGVAIGVAGFLLGGFTAINLIELLGYLSQQYFLPTFIIGGIIGLMLMFLIFDYALVFFSSVAGALVVVHAISFVHPVKTIVFLVLAMAGAMFQTGVHPRNYRFKR